MRKSKYETPLASLRKCALFSAREARELGLPARMLSHFARRGLFERIGRGLYRALEVESGVDFEFEELVLTASSIPQAVVCLISALSYWGFTDQIMREQWIAVPNSMKKPKRAHTKCVRMRNMTLGLVTVQMGNFAVKIFDRERSVVDAFRYLSHEVAIKALQAYLASVKPDLTKLRRYAQILRKNIAPYILALTT
jgi:predicted transcriptional regulator of viral defense system